MTLVALALVVVAVLAPLVPGAPAAAAPPPVTHPALVNPEPIRNTPHIVGTDVRTEAVLDLGTRVIVGGKFTQVKAYNQPTVFPRSYLFAYDKATGAIDPAFTPNPNGRVSALLRASDGGILVSGQFRTIGGREVPYVAKLDPVTGAASASFAPTPNGMVYDMHQANGNLYLGGTFSKVGGATRTNFAIVSATTGAVRSGPDVAFTSAPRGTTRVSRLDVTPDGTKLVAVGNFARVGSQTRHNVAVLNLTAGSATLATWNTARYQDGICGGPGAVWDTIIYDVDLSPDGSYFVIVTTGGPGGTSKLCDSAARWNTDVSGTANPVWVNWTGGDTITSVAITDAAVYVAGHMRQMNAPSTGGGGTVDREGVAALSAATGNAYSWNPGRDRGLVTPRLVPTAEGLYVLNDSDYFGGRDPEHHHPKLAYLTLTGTIPPPAGATPSATGVPRVTAPTASSATVSWSAATATRPITGHTVVARAGTTVLATREAGTALSTTFSSLPAGRAITFSVTPRTSVGPGPETTSAPAVLPFATVDAFTTQQYRDLVGRGPTGAELADWRAKVGGSTLTPHAAIDGLLGSDAVDELAAVVRLYRAYYERNPDGGGFRYWRDEVRRGKSINQVSSFFAGNKEFRTLYGPVDDGEFVDLVYQNVLGRSPSRNDRTYWVGELRRGVSRGRVMTLFSESPENKNATAANTDVLLVFHLMLDRKPTSSELGFTGARADLVRSVLTSTEYDNRV